MVLIVSEMASFMVESGGGKVFFFIPSWMDVDREICRSRLLFSEERHFEPLLGDSHVKLHCKGLCELIGTKYVCQGSTRHSGDSQVCQLEEVETSESLYLLEPYHAVLCRA